MTARRLHEVPLKPVPTSRSVSIIRAASVGLLMLQACHASGRPTVPELRYRTGPPQLVRGEVASIDPAYGSIGTLLLNHGRLWVVDYSGTPFIHVVNPGSGRVIQSIGRRGEGPGEFMTVVGLSTTGNSAVWVFDFNQQRLTELQPDSQLSEPKMVQLRTGRRLLRAFWVAGDRLAGIDQSDSSRIVIMSAAGAVVTTHAAPLLGTSRVPLTERVRASNGLNVCVRPGGAEFAILYFGAGQIQLFRGDGTFWGLARVPFATAGTFTNDPSGTIRFHRPRFWYSECAATAGHLYALFSGRAPASQFDQTMAYGADVHVFTWDGKLVAVWRLDRLAAGIAVDSSESTLFATLGDSAGIRRYAIGSLRSRSAVDPK